MHGSNVGSPAGCWCGRFDDMSRSGPLLFFLVMCQAPAMLSCLFRFDPIPLFAINFYFSGLRPLRTRSDLGMGRFEGDFSPTRGFSHPSTFGVGFLRVLLHGLPPVHRVFPRCEAGGGDLHRAIGLPSTLQHAEFRASELSERASGRSGRCCPIDPMPTSSGSCLVLIPESFSSSRTPRRYLSTFDVERLLG